jgi:hypothetical protein
MIQDICFNDFQILLIRAKKSERIRLLSEAMVFGKL